MNGIEHLGVADLIEQRAQLTAAAAAIFQSLAPWGGDIKLFLQCMQGSADVRQTVADLRQPHGLIPGHASRRPAERQLQVSAMLLKGIRGQLQIGHVGGVAHALYAAVMGQLGELTTSKRGAEELGGHVRYLVGLIDDKGVRPGQHVTETVFLEGHVGK